MKFFYKSLNEYLMCYKLTNKMYLPKHINNEGKA